MGDQGSPDPLSPEPIAPQPGRSYGSRQQKADIIQQEAVCFIIAHSARPRPVMREDVDDQETGIAKQ